jgi:hypothetical protein
LHPTEMGTAAPDVHTAQAIEIRSKDHPFQGDAVSPTLTDDGSINEVWLGMAGCSGSV